MNTLAPIILFVYNRPHHTRQCLDALAENMLASQSALIIFADGAKKQASPEDVQKIAEVRNIIENERRFKTVTIHASAVNKGLAASVIAGVSEILLAHEKVIVLEDDLVTGKYFLSFMNAALDKYKDVEEVVCISGYIYPTREPLPNLFFLKGADCWGWATWRRGWQVFDADGKALLQQLADKKLNYEFDFYNSYPYTKMLADQVEGKNSSWAIRWYASAFLLNKLILYPGKSLVSNIGLDGTGTHSGTKDLQQQAYPNDIPLAPIAIQENTAARHIIARYFRQSLKKSLVKRIALKIKSLLSK